MTQSVLKCGMFEVGWRGQVPGQRTPATAWVPRSEGAGRRFFRQKSVDIKYPPRKLESEGYDGPIEISEYQQFQWLREQLAKVPQGTKL
jgi:hypothetical protein